MSTLLATPRVEVALRVLAAGVGILFLLMGLGFLVMPEVLATALVAAEPARAVGINSLRGDFGGLFLGLSLFTLVGTSTRHHWLLLVPIVFLALIVMGRLISLVVDDLPLVVKGALASELAFLAILALSMRSTSLRPDAGGRTHVDSVVFRKRFALAIGIVVALVTLAFQGQRQIGMRLLGGLASSFVTANGLERLPDGLHVGLAGTGAPLPDQRRRGPCSFVLAGKHLFIVDSGPGSTLSLESMRVPLGDIQAVLLTHVHSDHIGGLGELMLKAWTRGARPEPLKVVGPEGVEAVVAGFNLAYSFDTGFRVAHHGPIVAPAGGAGGVAETLTSFGPDGTAVVFQTENLKVTAFLVDHRPVEPALGYRFDYKGRSVVISGDTLPSESLRRQAQSADVLLHEALQPEMLRVVHDAALAAGRVSAAKVTADILTYHTFPEEVARIARDANVGHVVLHHLIPPVPVRVLHSAFLGDARKIFPGPITIGIEGMVLSLRPDRSSVDVGWLL